VLGVSDPGRGGEPFTCGTGPRDDFDGNVQTQPGYGWTYTSVPASGHVSTDRQTHCIVNVYAWDNGQFDTAQVKLTYTYGVFEVGRRTVRSN